MGGVNSSLNDIENESKLIDELVLAAKDGHFNRVWEIIGEPSSKKSKAHLLNCIPETRRWGVLHQAVFWNNKDILKKLLEYEACNVDLLAKRCTSECGDTSGLCALHIARAYNYQDMADIICDHKSKTKKQKLHTFQSKLYLGLFNNTLAAYKSTFHPGIISPFTAVDDILCDIWVDLNENANRFSDVKNQICDAMYIVSEENAKMLEGTTTQEEFYEIVIKGYTMENNFLYNYISTAMRRQTSTEYKPTGEDLALGPFTIMCQMLLLFWKELEPECGETYRQMTMTETDRDKYKKGASFYWQSLVSSTRNETCARSFPTLDNFTGDCVVLFIIDNSSQCKWQPKNIEKYAFQREEERTYPAGAKFEVTDSPKQCDDHFRVKLSLIAY